MKAIKVITYEINKMQYFAHNTILHTKKLGIENSCYGTHVIHCFRPSQTVTCMPDVQPHLERQFQSQGLHQK